MTEHTAQQPLRRQDDPKPPSTTDLPTLRQRFAAAALTGLLSNPNFMASLGRSHPEANLDVSRGAFAIADAMIKAELE